MQIMKKEKIHKNIGLLFTKYPDDSRSDITHSGDHIDKIVFSLCKLFTWCFEVEQLYKFI